MKLILSRISRFSRVLKRLFTHLKGKMLTFVFWVTGNGAVSRRQGLAGWAGEVWGTFGPWPAAPLGSETEVNGAKGTEAG